MAEPFIYFHSKFCVTFSYPLAVVHNEKLPLSNGRYHPDSEELQFRPTGSGSSGGSCLQTRMSQSISISVLTCFRVRSSLVILTYCTFVSRPDCRFQFRKFSITKIKTCLVTASRRIHSGSVGCLRLGQSITRKCFVFSFLFSFFTSWFAV